MINQWIISFVPVIIIVIIGIKLCFKADSKKEKVAFLFIILFYFLYLALPYSAFTGFVKGILMFIGCGMFILTRFHLIKNMFLSNKIYTSVIYVTWLILLFIQTIIYTASPTDSSIVNMLILLISVPLFILSARGCFGESKLVLLFMSAYSLFWLFKGQMGQI